MAAISKAAEANTLGPRFPSIASPLPQPTLFSLSLTLQSSILCRSLIQSVSPLTALATPTQPRRTNGVGFV
jgi:hypothetical protein